MDFSLDRIKTFTSSISFLIDTMVQTGKHIYQQEGMISKPYWLNQSEKFSSFFERIKRNEEAIDKLKLEVVKPVFQTYELDFSSKLINDKNIVQDDFLKNREKENDEELTLNKPDGLFFNVDTLFLPFSEVYTRIVSYNKSYKVKNSPYPLLLLMGLYSTIFNAVKDQETATTNESFKENIQILLEGLEGCDGIPKRKTDNNPMNMLQNMMKNFDFSQMTDIIGKITGDEKSSKEFGEVFGKMTEGIKNGKNPLESMESIIKDVSSNLENDDSDVTFTKEEEVEETVEVKEVEVKEEVIFHPQLQEVPENNLESEIM